MKKLLLLISLLTTFYSKAQTSVYHAFPDSETVWSEEYLGVEGNSCCPTIYAYLRHERYEYFIGGDTTIGSLSYKKILKTGLEQDTVIGGPNFCSSACFQITYHYNEFVGALRQDSAQRKVFFISPLSPEQLLYDFNLNVGDTLPPTFNNYSWNRVCFIDSILIGNEFHRRLWLYFDDHLGIHDSAYASIIDGIGSTLGLLTLLQPNGNSEYSNSLLCVTINEITVYPDSNTNCDRISAIKNTRSIGISTSLFPNPFHTYALLQLTEEFQNAEIRIYNSIGKLIRHQTGINKSAIINRSNLDNGMYFYQVTNINGQISIGKFVIE